MSTSSSLSTAPTNSVQPNSTTTTPLISAALQTNGQPPAPSRMEQLSSSGVTLSPQLSSSSRMHLPPPPIGSYRLFNMPDPFTWTPAVSTTTQAPPAHGQQGWQQGPPRGHAPAGFPGFPPVENNYHNPPPPVVCQLCYSPGHSAITCPRFTNPSTPALAAIPTGETNASVWYPDSGASAHMTPHEGQSHGSQSSPGIQ
ncbi:unnamed protein product [Cuscuta epithymum]|uniref:Uncharacterized protein n=1 Tax=Cuscuta epithymum TaxID=186058 RepID=A0AAV0E0V9_9ASTE|nr:unnamed protein product [Cuscuta epithymum]